MKLPILTLLAATLPLAGCAGLIQTASVSEAYKHYERQQYGRTLELIVRAENAVETGAETRAELIYLKARAYEGLGESDIAIALYRYLAEQHAGSQYGYLASEQLKSRL